jgi:ribonuclease J
LIKTLGIAGIPFTSVHTSGHASVADLGRLITALSPSQVVPIHTDAADSFVELFPNVQAHDDGTWWAA